MPKKKSVQLSITSMGFPLLQKPAEMCLGGQINVPGKFLNVNNGRMHDQEGNTLIPVSGINGKMVRWDFSLITKESAFQHSRGFS